MTAFRLINFRVLSPQRKAPPPDLPGRAQVLSPRHKLTHEKAPPASKQRPANAPFPLACKQKTPDNAQAHSVPAMNRPARCISPRPARIAKEPRRSPTTESPIRAHSRFNPHPANRPHALLPIIPRKTARGQCTISQRPRHEPPRPARPFPFKPSSKSPACSLSRALFHRTQRAPDRKRTQASRPHPSPHLAHKSRTRKRARTMRKPTASPPINRSPARRTCPSRALPPFLPSIRPSHHAKSAEQESNSGAPLSSFSPSGALICLLNFHPRITKRAKLSHCSVSLRAQVPLSRPAKRAPNRNRTQASRPHPSPHPAHKSRTRKRAPDNAQAHSVPRHAPAPSGALIFLLRDHCSSMRRISSFFCSAAMKSSMLICPALY